jgi:hypothetical protein
MLMNGCKVKEERSIDARCTTPIRKAVIEILPSSTRILGIKEVNGFEEYENEDILFFAVEIDQNYMIKKAEKDSIIEWYEKIRSFLSRAFCFDIILDERCTSGYELNRKNERETFVLFLVGFRKGNEVRARQLMEELNREGTFKCEKARY